MEAFIELNIKIRDGSDYVVNEPPKKITIEKDLLTDEYSKDSIVIASGTTDQLVTITPVNNANLFYILTTETITVKKNSNSGEAWEVVADNVNEANQKYGFFAGTISGITSLYITNSSGTSAKVTIIAAS